MDAISPSMLHKLLRYDPETGKLFWRERTPDMFADENYPSSSMCRQWNSRYAGHEALTSNNYGYLVGAVMGKYFRAHRVILAMANGNWPELDVDHINGVRNDNRLSNLRCVSRSDNLKNQKINSRNTSGIVGVRWCKYANKWLSRIFHNGRNISLGPSNCITAAMISRKVAEKKYGYHENHGRAA